LRLDYIIGGGNVPISEDLDFRSKNLPGNQVRDFYRIIIKGIVEIGEPTSSRALQALCWIGHAKTPLTTRTLCEAVGAPSTDAILGPCMSLVVLSEATGFFQFSHNTTVTEFLADSQNFEDLGVRLITLLDLAKGCLQYLDSSKFMLLEVADRIRYDENVVEWYGFGGYSAIHWVDHVRDVENTLLKGGIEDLSHFKFLASQKKRNLMLKLNARATSTVLMFAAERGLSEFCRVCLAAKERSTQSGGQK
jgi:hypothetical protein